MKAKEFFELTQKVRAAQKTYYGNGRLQGDLIAAKQLESQLDKAIDAVKKAGGFEPDTPTATKEDEDAHKEYLRLVNAQELDLLLGEGES